MKASHYFFLAMLCLLHICRGQSVFDDYYKTGYHNNKSACVITEPDSGFVFVNYIIDSATYRSDLGLIRLDKNGNAIINKSFQMFSGECSSSNWAMQNFVEATPSSYLLLSGYSTGNNQGFLVTKLKRNTLDTLKTIIHIDAYSYGINTIIKFSDNKYFLVGNRWIGNTTSCFIFNLDSNLTILDTIFPPTPSDFGLFNATYNPVYKKILLAGGTATHPYLNTFIYIDTLGAISNVVYGTKYTDRTIAQMLYSPMDSTFIGIGMLKTGTFNNFDMLKLCISKYDLNMYPKWERTYGDAMPGNGLYDAVLLDDGSIAVTGGYSPLTSAPLGNANMNGIILKVDKKGQFQWAKEYDHVPPGSIGNMIEQFLGIDKTLDKGFIVCGSIVASPNNKSKAWAVKTDSMGCVIPGCTSSVLQLDSVLYPPAPTVGMRNEFKYYGVSVFPNPVKDLLFIKTDVTEQLTITLTDVYGRELMSQAFYAKTEVKTDPLNTGVYFLKIGRENEVIYSCKVIKE